MTLWKTDHGWRYRFQMQGQRYGKSGYRTKREAADAEAAHKKAVKKSTQTQAATDFRIIASEYLDRAHSHFPGLRKTYLLMP